MESNDTRETSMTFWVARFLRRYKPEFQFRLGRHLRECPKAPHELTIDDIQDAVAKAYDEMQADLDQFGPVPDPNPETLRRAMSEAEQGLGIPIQDAIDALPR